MNNCRKIMDTRMIAYHVNFKNKVKIISDIITDADATKAKVVCKILEDPNIENVGMLRFYHVENLKIIED